MKVVPGKRGFDCALAAVLIVVFAPLLLVLALLIKLDDGGPVLFRQQRTGFRGRPFTILKFRTMIVDAPARGRAITVGADARITRIGRWLRASKLDELPQLFNVLKAEMSFVGPRPEVPRYTDDYAREDRVVLARRPGLTDPSSLRYRCESDLLALAGDPEHTYRTRILPDKLRGSARYARRQTLASDLRVLVGTAFPWRGMAT